jgi:putative Holliday junction resolvase
MGRLLAIDYGSKRCGIAETDDLQLIASPLQTVATEQLMAFLEGYISRYKVDTIVVGDPVNWNMTASNASEGANALAQRLRKKFPLLSIDREDESFSSKLAMQAMIQGGVKKMARREKERLDKIAATIILQNYLERRRIKGKDM